MISADNRSMQEAGETLFTLNEDDRIRNQCEAREDYRRTWDGVKQDMDELQVKIAELKSMITDLKSINEKKDNRIASLEAQIAELQRRS